MAEEEAEEEGGEAAGEEEKKGLPIKLILIVVGVLALAGGGYFAYTNFFQEEAVEESAEGDKKGEEGEEGEEGGELPLFISVDPLFVVLRGCTTGACCGDARRGSCVGASSPSNTNE